MLISLTKYVEGSEKKDCPSVLVNDNFIKWVDFCYDTHNGHSYSAIWILEKEEPIKVWEILYGNGNKI